MSTSEQPKWMTWTGRVLSAIPVLMMIFSGIMKLSHSPQVVEGFGKFGFDPGQLTAIGILELVCVILYVVPQTALFGAVMMAAYLGGATVTHVRLHDPSAAGAVLFGVLVWVGLWLREPRLRALAPLRK
jgi:uncharacterized membrane protein YphA (DoxX/SURF4 family)